MSATAIVSDTFATILRKHAAEQPRAPALTFEGVTQDFGELNAATSRLANALIARGVGPTDRVAFLTKNRAECYHLIHACSKVGASLVALNWRLSEREISQILADAAPSVIMVDETGGKLLPKDLDGTGVVRFGDEFNAMCDVESDNDPGYCGSADEVALILYTSGTTGLPKGVMLTNRAMSFTRNLAEAWGMSARSVNLVAMPLFHIGGCGYGSSTMMAGGHTVLMSDVDIAKILELIPRYRVTHTFLVPAVVQRVLNWPGVEQADMSSMELLMYGAAPIGEVLLRRALETLNCKFMHAYGMTETAGTIVILNPEVHDPNGSHRELLKSCGRAMPWVELRIVDPASNTELPHGEIGEIWVRTPMLMKGYWRNEAATRKAFAEDGWFRTGDAGYINDEGYIFLVDRFKDMIISGGENIYPAEIENLLNGHPAVAEVGVIGIGHERWGETPLAVVVLRDGTSVTEEELLAYTRSNLATYKCPTRIIIAETLPRNASGKLMKPEMRQIYGTAT